jgi:hypothetical protein
MVMAEEPIYSVIAKDYKMTAEAAESDTLF